jgi:hypothetical protein
MGLGWIVDKARNGLLASGARGPKALQAIPEASWESDPAVAGVVAALRGLGFQRIGTFQTTQEPRNELGALYFPQAHFYGLVHPPAGGRVEFELCCQLDDFAGVSVTNSAQLDTWHDSPGNLTHRFPDAPVGVVFSNLLQKTSGHDRLPASPDTFICDFERALTRKLEWRQRQEAALKVLAERKAS